uniref:Putative secreted protein n=1 Tax=Anopheles marajoara TaxID=58244 RepID=A0A2M4C5P3_9DIPT
MGTPWVWLTFGYSLSWICVAGHRMFQSDDYGSPVTWNEREFRKRAPGSHFCLSPFVHRHDDPLGNAEECGAYSEAGATVSAALWTIGLAGWCAVYQPEKSCLGHAYLRSLQAHDDGGWRQDVHLPGRNAICRAGYATVQEGCVPYGHRSPGTDHTGCLLAHVLYRVETAHLRRWPRDRGHARADPYGRTYEGRSRSADRAYAKRDAGTVRGDQSRG